MKLNCFYFKKEKVYKVGDFSFIKNPIERASMDFDYRVFKRLKVVSFGNTVSQMNYSIDTYITNIKNISYIEKNGWASFVKNYGNI